MIRRALLKVLSSPFHRSALFLAAKTLVPRDPVRARSLITRVAESSLTQSVYRTAINKPQTPASLTLSTNQPMKKFAGKRVKDDNKHAILLLHGGAFSMYLPTMYSYLADYLNVLTSLPVCHDHYLITLPNISNSIITLRFTCLIIVCLRNTRFLQRLTTV